MQISLKLIWLINHAKITVCIKFQLLVTFSSLFTGSSSLSVFPRAKCTVHNVKMKLSVAQVLKQLNSFKSYVEQTQVGCRDFYALDGKLHYLQQP